MSFPFRPTPVVLLSGWDAAGEVYYPFGFPGGVRDTKWFGWGFPSPIRGGRWYGYGFKGDTTYPARGGTMEGYTPNMTSPRLNYMGRRTISGNPWLIASGTMGSFLGEDLTPPDIFGPIDAPPIDWGPPPVAPFDYGGAWSSPTIPTPPIFDTPIAPDIGSPSYGPLGPLLPMQPPVAPLPPIASASRPPVAQAAVGPAAVSAWTAASNALKSFFTPKATATPMIAAMPGVYKATTVTPSFFGQSTLLPGVSNSMAVIGGLAVLVAFAALTGGKKR